MSNSIHQFVSTISPRDAVGNIIVSIQKILHEAGYHSEIYAETIHPEMKKYAKSYSEYNNKNSDEILIYHHGFASNLVDYLLPLKNKIILIYHNITPASFFIELDDETVAGCIRGREQLDQLRDKVIMSLAFSKYSEKELIQKKFKNTAVIPAIIDLKKIITKDFSLTKKLNNSVEIICVGRIVPHKKVEDILKVFAFYNQCINNNSKLLLIGKYNDSDAYLLWLKDMIEKLDLKNVTFINDISDEELASHYENADIYLSMSEHEGFCIPLVESMHHNLPIVAFASAAVPETLDTSGLLIHEKKFEEIAEIIHLIIEDKNLRETLIKKQNHRLENLDLKATSIQFLRQIKNLENISIQN